MSLCFPPVDTIFLTDEDIRIDLGDQVVKVYGVTRTLTCLRKSTMLENTPSRGLTWVNRKERGRQLLWGYLPSLTDERQE